MGAADYIALANKFHTIALSGVPVFTADIRSQAYRCALTALCYVPLLPFAMCLCCPLLWAFAALSCVPLLPFADFLSLSYNSCELRHLPQLDKNAVFTPQAFLNSSLHYRVGISVCLCSLSMLDASCRLSDLSYALLTQP